MEVVNLGDLGKLQEVRQEDQDGKKLIEPQPSPHVSSLAVGNRGEFPMFRKTA